jgi:hypothetical protein
VAGLKLLHHVRQRQRRGRAPALGALLVAGVVDQDMSHQRRRHAEKVGAVLPMDGGLVHQPQVRLVHQSRRL